MPRGPKGEKRPADVIGNSPAMQAGVSDTLWSVTNLAEMIDAASSEPKKRGPYKKRILAQFLILVHFGNMPLQYLSTSAAA